MPKIIYHIVKHDGGWAYQVDGAFSEPYRSHDAARKAAEQAAREQQGAAEDAAISFEDADGRWHEEMVQRGDPQPDTEVEG